MGSRVIVILGAILLAGLLAAAAAGVVRAQEGAKSGSGATFDPTTGVSTKKPDFDPTTGVSTKKPEFDPTTGVSTKKPEYDPTTGLSSGSAQKGRVRGLGGDAATPDASRLPRMKSVTIQVFNRKGNPVDAEVEVTTDSGSFNKTCTTDGGSCRMAVRCCPGSGLPVMYRVKARWRGLESREMFLVDCGYGCDQPVKWVIRYYTSPQVRRDPSSGAGHAPSAPPSTLKRYTTSTDKPKPEKKKPPKRYDPDWRPWSSGR